MHKIVILIGLFFMGCFTTRNIKRTRYYCVKNLVEIEVPAKEAISFCSENFQEEVE